MCSVRLRVRVRGGPRASATGRGGARREAGAACDWQDWPARFRARLRARGRPPAAGWRARKNNVRPQDGPEGGALPLAASFGSCCARCLPEHLPSGARGGGDHLGNAPESTALAPSSWQSPLSPKQRLFLRRGRAGSRGARSVPCWIVNLSGCLCTRSREHPQLVLLSRPFILVRAHPCWDSHGFGQI